MKKCSEKFILGQGHVIWLMGPTGSGKTTIAKELVARLNSFAISAVNYDGDEIRNMLGPNLGFSKKDRLKVIKRIVYLAEKSAAAGTMVIVSALTAHDDARKYIVEHIQSLTKVYIKCELEECMKRDPKGLYEKARKGEIDTLIVYNTPYVAPDSSDLIIDSQHLSPDKSVDKLVDYLIKNIFLPIDGKLNKIYKNETRLPYRH